MPSAHERPPRRSSEPARCATCSARQTAAVNRPTEGPTQPRCRLATKRAGGLGRPVGYVIHRASGSPLLAWVRAAALRFSLVLRARTGAAGSLDLFLGDQEEHCPIATAWDSR